MNPLLNLPIAPGGGSGGGAGVSGLDTADGGDAIADNEIIRGDGTTGIQGSVAILSDAGALSALTQLDVDNIRVDGNTISSTNADGDITLTPNGTGEVEIVLAASGAYNDPQLKITRTDTTSTGGLWTFASDEIGFSSNSQRTIHGVLVGGVPFNVIPSTGQLVWDDSFGGDFNPGTPDAGFARSAAGVVKVTDGGAGDGILRVAVGSAGTPSFSFSADPNTGIYNEGAADYLAFSTAGTRRAYFSPTGTLILEVSTVSLQGGALNQYTNDVVASTAGSGAPNVIDGAYSSRTITNEGAAAENYNTLPPAVAGYKFTFVVQDADGIRITAAAGDTIRPIAGTAASATGGFIRCATLGAFITLLAINATEWISIGSAGVWTIDV